MQCYDVIDVERFDVVTQATEKIARRPVVGLRVHFTYDPWALCFEEPFRSAERFKFGAFDVTLYRVGWRGRLNEIV